MENIKKKRGRKPKVKVEEDPPKKKRGRKPKVVSEGEEPKKPLKIQFFHVNDVSIVFYGF